MDFEKKVRTETQTTLMRLIDDMEKNLMKDVQIEQEERIQNEEKFMELLEQTCTRIERNL